MRLKPTTGLPKLYVTNFTKETIMLLPLRLFSLSKNYTWCTLWLKTKCRRIIYAVVHSLLIVKEPLRENYFGDIQFVSAFFSKGALFGLYLLSKEQFTVDSLIYTFLVNILYQRIIFMDRSLVYTLKNWVNILH